MKITKVRPIKFQLIKWPCSDFHHKAQTAMLLKASYRATPAQNSEQIHFIILLFSVGINLNLSLFRPRHQFDCSKSFRHHHSTFREESLNPNYFNRETEHLSKTSTVNTACFYRSLTLSTCFCAQDIKLRIVQNLSSPWVAPDSKCYV